MEDEEYIFSGFNVDRFLKSGPSHVVTSREGDYDSYDKKNKTDIGIIFLHADDWSLGSSLELQDVAFGMGEWVAFVDVAARVVLSIQNYHLSDGY